MTDPAGTVFFGGSGGAYSVFTSSSERLRISAAGTTQVTGGFEAAQPGAGANAFAAGVNAGNSGQATSATAVGLNAGYENQAASAVAIGNSAGNNTQGDSSVAVGNSAGFSIQAAGAVAVGRTAGRDSQGSKSVAIGYDAARTTQGNNAVAIGWAAGQTTQGSSSVAIGNGAGRDNQGVGGIIINSSGSVYNNTTDYHIALYSGANKSLIYNGTNSWTFKGGDVTVPNDNLLVGTTSAVGPTTNEGVKLYADGRGFFIAETASATGLFGRSSNGNSLAFYVAGVGAGGVNITSGGTPTFSAASDERLKDNITDHESELSNVMALRPTRWDWKDEAKGTGEGFIAQELEQTAWSDLVSEGDDGFKQVSGLGAVETRLIKAIQEQQAMIETLQAEVAALKGA